MNGPLLILGLVVMIVFFRRMFLRYPTTPKKFTQIFTSVTGGITRVLTRPKSPKTSPSRLFQLLLVLVAGAIIYWGFFTPAMEASHLGSVGPWSWKHWLPVLILLTLLWLVVTLEVGAEFARKAFKKPLQIIAFMLFLGIPILYWLTSPSSVHSAPEYHSAAAMPTVASIPLTSSPQSNWPAARLPARIQIPAGYTIFIVGENMRMSIECANGTRIPQEDTERSCPDNWVPYEDVESTIDKPNVIRYAFKRN